MLFDRTGNPILSHCAIAIVIVIVGLLLAFGSWDTVQPGHRGVAVTAGAVQTDHRGEGFTVKLPFITRIVQVSVQQQTVATIAQCFSADTQAITVAANVLFRIPEGRVVELYQQYKGDPFPSLIEPRLQESLKQITAQYTADKIVKSRQEIKALTLDLVRKSVGDIITIVDINIANIDLSNQLEQAIESKMVQEQEALAMSFKLDKARKDAEIKVVEATAEAESVKIKGEALAKAKDVIQLEIVRKWNGISPTTVVVGSGGENILLPLPRVENETK